MFGVVTLFTTEPNFDNIYGAKAAVEAGDHAGKPVLTAAV